MVQNRRAENQDNTLGQDKQMARIIVFKMVIFFLCLVPVHPLLSSIAVLYHDIWLY